MSKKQVKFLKALDDLLDKVSGDGTNYIYFSSPEKQARWIDKYGDGSPAHPFKKPSDPPTKVQEARETHKQVDSKDSQE